MSASDRVRLLNVVRQLLAAATQPRPEGAVDRAALRNVVHGYCGNDRIGAAADPLIPSRILDPYHPSGEHRVGAPQMLPL